MTKRLFTVFIFLSNIITFIHATDYTYTWTGAGGNTFWDNGANWSVSPSSPPSAFPRNLMNDRGFAVFNSNATVTLPNADFFLQSITIQSGSNVTVVSNSTGNISVGLEGSGLFVQSGAYLKLDAGLGMKLLMNATANNGIIAGTLELAGTGGSGNSVKFEKPNFVTPVHTVASGGKIIISGNNAQVVSTTASNLIFQAGSELNITRNSGVVPGGEYQAGSMVKITGVTTSITTFSSEGKYNGDIEWNCLNQTASGTSASTGLSSLGGNAFGGTFFMKAGFLMFQGTLSSGFFTNIDVSGGTFALRTTSSSISNRAVNGNINVSGTGKFVVSSGDFGSSFPLTVSVAGNVTQSGGIIDIAPGSSAQGILSVAGNFTQTGGILTETGGTANSKLLFTGSNAQTATFATGNLGGDALNVEINKPSNNVTLLSSVSVPKDLMLTAGHIILGSNNLTVNNVATGGSAVSHVVTDASGALTINSVGITGKDFPVGISASSYDLVNIKNAVAVNNFSVSVSNILSAGIPPSYVNVIPRQWEIVSNSVGATLAFTPGTVTVNSSEIGHLVAGTWEFIPSTTSSPTYTGTFTSFSPFIIASQVLPVELVSFTGRKVGNINVLNWQTATEKNNSHFDIERSSNGENGWDKIGLIKGNGNSIVSQKYAFTDNAPLSISYYRLKQVDFDGQFKYSNVVSVLDKKGKFNIASVAPNPTKETSTILFESAKNENVSVTLTDVSGRVILIQNVFATEGVNSLGLNMSDLNNGLYIMSLRNSEQVLIQKIIKQ
jgi:Secretion system C-terminal sorting domain